MNLVKRRLATRRPPLTLAVMPPPAEAPSFAVGMKELLFGTKLNVLLVCVPLAIGGSTRAPGTLPSHYAPRARVGGGGTRALRAPLRSAEQRAGV